MTHVRLAPTAAAAAGSAPSTSSSCTDRSPTLTAAAGQDAALLLLTCSQPVARLMLPMKAQTTTAAAAAEAAEVCVALALPFSSTTNLPASRVQGRTRSRLQRFGLRTALLILLASFSPRRGVYCSATAAHPCPCALPHTQSLTGC